MSADALFYSFLLTLRKCFCQKVEYTSNSLRNWFTINFFYSILNTIFGNDEIFVLAVQILQKNLSLTLVMIMISIDNGKTDNGQHIEKLLSLFCNMVNCFGHFFNTNQELNEK